MSKQNLILPVLAVSVLAVDQISKGLVTAGLQIGQSWDRASWLAPLFSVTYVTNTGAAFGLFPGLGGFFVMVATIVVAAIVIYYLYLPDGQLTVRAALGLQLGGALGNLIDRLRRGFVVDFIDLNFWPMHNWPVFNLADSAIVAGVTILFVMMLWEEWRLYLREPETGDSLAGLGDHLQQNEG